MPAEIPRARIERQEAAYFLFYLGFAILLAANGMAGTVAFGAMLGLMAGAGLVIVCCGRPSAGLGAKRVRWFYFMAGMPVCYYALGAVVRRFRPDAAGSLRQVDGWLTGGNGDGWIGAIGHPILTEVLSWCYMGFFAFLLLGLWRHGWMAGLRAGRFFRALGLLYALGFWGYIFCPAAGPWHDFPSAVLPPPGGPGWRWNTAMVEWGSNRVDCFPSLHCAVAGLILAFDARVSRKVFYWHLPVVAGIWLSTVYLRQHYLTDVAAGLLLLGAALWLGRRGSRGEDY